MCPSSSTPSLGSEDATRVAEGDSEPSENRRAAGHEQESNRKDLQPFFHAASFYLYALGSEGGRNAAEITGKHQKKNKSRTNLDDLVREGCNK